MGFLCKQRYDYILIWGHGLQYQAEILEMIRKRKWFQIVKIFHHHAQDVPVFVREVYSFDYAPFQHLKAKTRYLMTLPGDVAFIFVKNLDVQELLKGRGAFRHLECDRIRELKEAIRNGFNPRVDDGRTEDHVIHASDNERQTDNILHYLGFPGGVESLRQRPHEFLPDLPHHIAPFTQFTVCSVPISKLACNLLCLRDGKKPTPAHQLASVWDTPHYGFLKGDAQPYREYYARGEGKYFCDDHGPEQLLALAGKLSYLSPPHEHSYILTRYSPEDDGYVILDGVHRAAILASQGNTDVVVAVVE